MSDFILTTTPSQSPPGLEAGQETPRTWLAQVMADTFTRFAARLGLMWIAVIAFCAVFAPLLSNSYPLLLKMDGHWSSPMVEHLTPTDVTLLISFAVAVVLMLLRRIPLAKRALIFLIAVLLTLAASWFFVKPSQVQVYEQYRERKPPGACNMRFTPRCPSPPATVCGISLIPTIPIPGLPPGRIR